MASALPVLANEGGLSRYLDEIRKFPMLEPSEEYMLAKRWREHGDRDAAHKLVTSHLRLVAKIAMGYRGYGLPISEVVGGQCRPDAGRETLRTREGLPPRHLRDVVDQGGDSRVHPALVVAREDGHHREPEEALLQPAQGQGPHLGLRGGRPAPRPGEADRPPARRDRAGRGGHEPPARRRRLPQRAPARGGRRRMAGLARRRARARNPCSPRPRRARTALQPCATR